VAVCVVLTGTRSSNDVDLELAAARAVAQAAATQTRAPHASSGQSDSGQVRPALSEHRATSSPYPSTPPGYFQQGLSLAPVAQVDNAAKARFDLATVVMLVNQKITPQAAPNPLTRENLVGQVYVASPKGSADPVGTFPSVTVATLGFGLLPVTAVVHITQVRNAAGYLPLSLSFSFTGRPDSSGWFYEGRLTLSGEVSIRLSDVNLDGQAVNVGNDCHTNAPASIDFEAAPGKYKNSPAVRVPSDLYLPEARVPGSVRGLVNVPSFTGCTEGGQNFNTLLTKMVSGPNNPIKATQAGPLGTFIPPTYTK
jgi:hypothetical protein